MSISSHLGNIWSEFWTKRKFYQNRALLQFKAVMILKLLAKELEKVMQTVLDKTWKKPFSGHFGTVRTQNFGLNRNFCKIGLKVILNP